MAEQKWGVETLQVPFPDSKPECQQESEVRGEKDVGFWFGYFLPIWNGGLNEIDGVLYIRLGLHMSWGGADLDLNGCVAHVAHGFKKV